MMFHVFFAFFCPPLIAKSSKFVWCISPWKIWHFVFTCPLFPVDFPLGCALVSYEASAAESGGARVFPPCPACCYASEAAWIKVKSQIWREDQLRRKKNGFVVWNIQNLSEFLGFSPKTQWNHHSHQQMVGTMLTIFLATKGPNKHWTSGMIFFTGISDHWQVASPYLPRNIMYM